MPVWIFGWPLRRAETIKVARHRGLAGPNVGDSEAIAALIMDILNKPDTERVHCYLCRGDDGKYLPVIGIAKDRKPTVEEAVFVERRLPPPRTVYRIVRQLRTFEDPSWFRYEDNLGLPEGVEGPDPPQILPNREYDSDDFYDDDEDYGTDYTDSEDDEDEGSAQTAGFERAQSPEHVKPPRSNRWVRRPSSPVVYGPVTYAANDSEESD